MDSLKITTNKGMDFAKFNTKTFAGCLFTCLAYPYVSDPRTPT